MKEKKETKLSKDMKKTKKQIETELNQKNEELLRAIAEIQNLTRRIDEEREKARKCGREEVALKISEVFEHIYNALNMAEEISGNENFAQGFRMLKHELEAKMESIGLKMLNPFGEKFDHKIHHAVSVVESDDEEDGKIVEVIRKGFQFGDTVIKPSLVKVTRKKERK